MSLLCHAAHHVGAALLPVLFAGHVTTGGSVCLEALTLSGGPGAWRSDM